MLWANLNGFCLFFLHSATSKPFRNGCPDFSIISLLRVYPNHGFGNILLGQKHLRWFLSCTFMTAFAIISKADYYTHI